MPPQMNPAMQDLVGQFDMDSPAMKQQLAQLGTSPDEVRIHSHADCMMSRVTALPSWATSSGVRFVASSLPL